MQKLTIAEAAELTGRHPDTIRRLIKRLLNEDSNAESNIKKELVSGGFCYRISKDYLLEHIPALSATVEMPPQQPMQADAHTKFAGGQQTPQGNMHPSNQPHTGGHTDGQATSMQGGYADGQLLRETIDLLKEQLREKDKQIEQLLERDREKNILLKGYQDRYLLEAPKEQKAEKTIEEAAIDTPQIFSRPRKLKSKKPEQQKRKGFFSFLRRK